jgi:hypothetical protein
VLSFGIYIVAVAPDAAVPAHALFSVDDVTLVAADAGAVVVVVVVVVVADDDDSDAGLTGDVADNVPVGCLHWP